MKIIFLDVDGVLNTMGTIRRGEDIAEEFLDRLKAIVFATEAKIVLSSSWRYSPDGKIQISEALATRGLEFIDCTIMLKDWQPRAVEIQEWLDRHEVEKFAILDDNPDAGINDLSDSFFQTSSREGLTDVIAARVIEHLREILVPECDDSTKFS